jgi:hemerythrin-like domain-containing protein
MMIDPIQMLKNDHEKLLSMLESLDTRTPEQRDSLLDDIERELKIHSQLEEEILYPAFREAAENPEDRKMYFEATEEHHVADMVLPELKVISSDSDRFAARAKVFTELIKHHIEEEEEDLLPRSQELLGDRMPEIGSRMAERRIELEKQWSSTIGRAAHKLKSAADKFMPASAKDRDDEARPR